jgi:hypothetical protein
MATLATTPAMSIDALPTEIIAMVCGFLKEGDFPSDSLSKKYHPEAKALPRDALCSFRLASKDCAAAATSYLFRHLHILYTKRSFQNLLNISKSAHLAKHVRSICYEPRTLKENLSEEHWADYCEMVQCGAEEPKLSISDIRTGQRWEVFETLVSEQPYLRETAWISTIFTLAIPQFTCLDAITIDVDCDPSYRAQQLLPPPFDLDTILHEDLKDHMTMNEHYQSIEALFVATALTNINLVTLHMLPVSEDLLSYFHVTENVILPAFKHLRNLSMNIDHYHRPDEINKGLENLLRSAPGLESLSIRFSFDFKWKSETKHTPSAVWDKTLAGLTFPNLQRLELSHLPTHPSSFIKFLERHATTLKHVVLDSMWLLPHPMDWHNIFDVLKDDLSLESATFQGFWRGSSKDEERPHYYAHMDGNIDGYRAQECLEDRVLKRAPVLMEQFPTIEELWAAIVATF